MPDPWHYRAFGIAIRSDLALPELEPDLQPAPAGPGASVLVMLEAADPGVDECPADSLWHGDGQTFELHVPGVARFRVRAGGEIRVTPSPGAGADAIRAHLLATPFAMLLYQQGAFPMQAAAVATRQGAVLFAGPSAAGKSTLAAWCAQAGFSLLGDDLTTLRLDVDGIACCGGIGSLRLWADMHERLPGAAQGVRDLEHGVRYRSKMPGPTSSRPTPLARIYLLEENRLGRQVRIQRLQGLDAVQAVAMGSWNPYLVQATGGGVAHFRQSARLAAAVPVLQLGLPMLESELPRVVEQLARDWREDVS